MWSRRFVAVASLGLAVVVGGVDPALAWVQPTLDGGGDPSYSGDAGDGGADITGHVQESTGGGAGPVEDVPAGDVADVPAPPEYEYKKVPNCLHNTAESGSDTLCGPATMTCDEGEIRYRIYRRRTDGVGGWETQGTQCLGPGEEIVPEPEVTAGDVFDRARAMAPETVFYVEPARRSFVNVPNNFYAESRAETVTVQVLGAPIAVRFAPRQYAWDFGDGATAHGVGVEGAEVGAEGAVEHAYRRDGDYDVTLTRTYRVSFTLPSGEDVSIPGQVSNTSEPYPLAIGEVQSVVTDVE